MRLTSVRSPQDQQIRLVDLSIGRRTAARTKHRRQTDDARSVSSAVARVDVVRPHHRTHELLSQEIDLVRRLRAAEHPERTRRVLYPCTSQTRSGEIERLIPARKAKRPVLAHQRLRQPATKPTQTNHLPSSSRRDQTTNQFVQSLGRTHGSRNPNSRPSSSQTLAATLGRATPPPKNRPTSTESPRDGQEDGKNAQSGGLLLSQSPSAPTVGAWTFGYLVRLRSRTRSDRRFPDGVCWVELAGACS